MVLYKQCAIETESQIMTPLVFRYKNYKFYFFSREEPRIHIHISCPDGEAKFWLEPIIALASYRGLSERQLKQLVKVVEEHAKEIKDAWQKHFDSRN